MRYRRGIMRFLLPSIFLHILIFSLVLYSFKSTQHDLKLDQYEIGLIKLSNKKTGSSENTLVEETRYKLMDAVNPEYINKPTVNKPVIHVKNENMRSTNVKLDNTEITVDQTTMAVSVYPQQAALSEYPGSANSVSEQAYPDYRLNPKPDYPLLARRRGYQGTVFIRVKVLENGKVAESGIKKSSKHEILDRTALAAVSNWTFIPAKKNGISVTSWVTVPIKFELKDG